MTTATEQSTSEQATTNERLVRVEATVEALVREMGHMREDTRHLRTEMRIYFIALLTLMITMWVSLIVVLISQI